MKITKLKDLNMCSATKRTEKLNKDGYPGKAL
jgi:hypothetical protein